jgi:hypothetical protein
MMGTGAGATDFLGAVEAANIFTYMGKIFPAPALFPGDRARKSSLISRAASHGVGLAYSPVQ